MGDSNAVKLVRHETAESVVRAFWSFGGEDFDPEQGEIFACGADGVEVQTSLPEMIAGIEQIGVWGYTARQGNAIHYWASSGVSPGLLLEFIGHELAHIRLDTEDEALCDAVGRIAAEAVRVRREME